MDLSVDLITMIVSLLGTNSVTLAVSRYLNSRIQTETSDRWQKLANEYQSETTRLRDRLEKVEQTVAQTRGFYDAEIRWLKEQDRASTITFNERIELLEAKVEVQAAIIDSLRAQLRAQGVEPQDRRPERGSESE